MAALSCPSCGAAHEPRNPGIMVIVCDNCDTTLYLEEDVLRAGIQAKVAQPASGLAVGQSGRVGGRSIDLVGRVRFAFDGGVWDEWYVLFADGGEGWLVDDGRTYSLEERLEHAPEEATPHLRIGDILPVDGARFEVRETGLATCEGGEGQLPRPIEPGRTVLYVDASEVQGARRLLFEFSGTTPTEAFLGLTVDPADIDIRGVERPPAGGGREADTIRCAQCGAPVVLPTKGEPVETLACTSCDAVLQLTATDNVVVGNRGETPDFVLDIGDSGELDGTRWEVMGRLRLSDQEGYASDDFLLWSESERGYLWLEYDDRHMVATRKVAVGPALDDVFATRKKGTVRVGDKTFRLRGEGVSTVTYVDGALPWAARIGHRQQYIELIAPPTIHVIEGGEGEVEHYQGTWLDSRKVLTAFGRNDRYERPFERHFLAANGWTAWIPVGVIALFFALFNVLLCVGTVPATTLTQVQVEPIHFGETQLSKPFRIEPGTNVLSVDVRSNVQNGWAYGQIELIPASNPDDTVALTGLEVSHYTGSEGGERWVESDQQNRRAFRAPEPGTYSMALLTKGDRRTRILATLQAEPRLVRYNVCLAFFSLFLGGALVLLWRGRESARYED